MSVTASVTAYELGARDVAVLRAVVAGKRTVREISASTALSGTTVRRAVTELAAWGLVVATGTVNRAATFAPTAQGARSWSSYAAR